MSTPKVIIQTRDELLAERAALLAEHPRIADFQYGCDCRSIYCRTDWRHFTSDELAALQELEDISFLLGDDPQ